MMNEELVKFVYLHNTKIMSRKILVLLVLITVFFAACKKETNHSASVCPLLSADDYLVFGTYYGFCAGNCTSLYKLTTTEVYEDDINYFEKEKDVVFRSQPLGSSKLSLAAELCRSFPFDSIISEKETIGCPDCHDQGVVYVELKKNGLVRKWFIDPDANQNDVPAYLKSYVKLVKTTVEKLK